MILGMHNKCECCGEVVGIDDIHEFDNYFEGVHYEFICSECGETIYGEKPC